MNSSQRWFLVTSLILLAVGVALYCLNYRVVDADSSEGRVLAILLNSPKPERESLKAELENSPERRAVIPLVSFGESQPRPPWEETHGRVPTDSELSSFLESKSTFSGIYPRTGLSPLEATIGGVLVPILLLISASYLALGARKTTSNKETTTPTTTLSKSASTEIDQSAEQQSEIDIPKPEQLAELREPSKQGTRAAISGLLITGVVACTGVGLIIAGSSDGGAILMFLILTLALVFCFPLVSIFTVVFWGMAFGVPTVSITHGIIPAIRRNGRLLVGIGLWLANALTVLAILGYYL